jgi:hypothetical protein
MEAQYSTLPQFINAHGRHRFKELGGGVLPQYLNAQGCQRLKELMYFQGVFQSFWHCGISFESAVALFDMLLSFLQLQEFSPALSREFKPYKPSAAPLLHICNTWGASPSEVLMVGDSAKDDVSF